ncbi:hypothetical protein KJ359_012118 [Pestalotiopsis sp. 9143b]|nr:hypothetical protein KJ359_012118 [Pestalotiopsis sp. 9143b]
MANEKTSLGHSSAPVVVVMPPNQTNTGARRGRPPGAANKSKVASNSSSNARTSGGFSRPSVGSASAAQEARNRQEMEDDSEPDPFADSQDDAMDVAGDSPAAGKSARRDNDDDEDDADEDDPKATIPPELLTRLLHEFFEKDGSRISKDANEAVAKYMDIFVREAIARAAVEKSGGFLDVDDLEKIAPQLLLDL